MTNPLKFAGVLAAGLLVGCATHQPATSPQTVVTGPNAMIHATYFGGMLNRQTEAVFKVDEGSYVMVAHLGGDGRVTVLYPEDGRESGRVAGGKWFRTNHVAAYYDAAPQLYNFAMTRFRTVGAQLDSYDGRGYGFVFLIASKYPLRFDKVSEFGLWNEMQVHDYRQTSDPRIFVNVFAREIAGSHPFTLKFARSYSTFASTSYSDQLFDCAFLSQYSFSSFWMPFGFSSLFSPSLAFPGAGNGCSRSMGSYAYYRPVVFTASAPPTNTAPPGPSSPPPGRTLRPRRPGFDNPRTGLGFASPVLNNSPERPARAPRDWRSLHTQVGTFGGSSWEPRRGADADRSRSSSGSASGASTQAATMRAPDHRPVVERAAPVSQPSSSQSSSKPKGDQN
jgi:hypothetical protein